MKNQLVDPSSTDFTVQDSISHFLLRLSLKKIDVVAAGKDKLRIPALEEEIRKMFKDDALREKHLPVGGSGDDLGLLGF